MRRTSAARGYVRSATIILILSASAGAAFVAWQRSLRAAESSAAAANSLAAGQVRGEVPMMARAAPSEAVNGGASLVAAQADGAALLERGRSARQHGDLLGARRDLSAALAMGLPTDVAPGVRQELAGISDQTLFTPSSGFNDPLIARHRVGAGETLARISVRYRVPEDFVGRLNGLSNKHHIRSGMVLRVVEGPFRVMVNKAAFRLDVYLRDTFVRSFSVGLGSNGSTPTGTWRVVGKLRNPSWSDPRTGRRFAADDSTNPIGEHWIGLEGLTGDAVGKVGFGIHGTIDPGSIGHNASLGCVRMVPEDVALLFDWLIEGYSTVEVR